MLHILIAGYRPHRNLEGIQSVYAQQRMNLLSIDDDQCPLLAFHQDPQKEMLSAWLEEGDQLFLLMEVNEDMRTGGTSKILLELGL